MHQTGKSKTCVWRWQERSHSATATRSSSAKATDDHTLIGGHHRLAVAVSLGQKHSGKVPAKLCGLIPSSREVLIDRQALIDIQLDAQAT